MGLGDLGGDLGGEVTLEPQLLRLVGVGLAWGLVTGFLGALPGGGYVIRARWRIRSGSEPAPRNPTLRGRRPTPPADADKTLSPKRGFQAMIPLYPSEYDRLLARNSAGQLR